MKTELQPLAAVQSFAVVGWAPYVDQLIAAMERLGHRVVTSARAQGVLEPVDHVIYLVSGQVGSDESWSEKIVARIEQLRLLVELQNRRSTSAHLCMLTQGIYSPGNDGPSDPLVGSALAAVTRVIAKEYPLISCTTIDLPVVPDELIGSIEKAARVLSSDSHEPALCITGGMVQEPEVKNLAGVAQTTVCIDAEGNYLITGGFGETGLALMRQLVGAGVTVRSRPSDTLIAQANNFKENGVQVKLFQWDVCVFADVAALMRSVQPSGRPLKGIYHLAGIMEDSVLARLAPATLRRNDAGLVHRFLLAVG